MNVDVIKNMTDDGVKYAVHPAIDDAYAEYSGTPLFESAEEYAVVDWCEDNGHKATWKEHAALVQSKFLRDLEKKCDGIRADMMEQAKAVGWKFETHVTYRASANWKDDPIHYAYVGDFGSIGKFVGWTKETHEQEAGRNAQWNHERLIAIAEGIWELGFTLTFDKDGKHTIYGNLPKWVAVENP